ncbi:MAG TPA: SDR family NAD(P)-dependent oxidoreductase [Acidimicrobiia bacterium]|nr:SDR family NAD(P)-dependent oxidoreductase [Acidimicrobiia bacterium]
MMLDGKVAIVTGASRGVGAATAVALAAEGARVACAARATDATPMPTPGTLDATVRRIRDAGGDAIAVPTNLAKDDEVVAMVQTTIERYGRVDVLVNNAAITFPGDLDLPMKRHDLIFAVNVRAPLIACQQVAPGMKERREGAILNVSSMAALNYFPGLMAYGMSKIALEHMTVSLATQLHPFGIAVNTFRIDIAVASEGFIANMPDADHSSWEPSEVAAEGILWMLRQPASYTGHNEAMSILRETRGIMKSRVERPTAPAPGTNRVNPMPFLDPSHAPVTGVEA